MASTSLITVTGVPECLTALNDFPAVLVAHAWLRGLQAAAAVMRNELEIRTPYSGESVSGRTARTGIGNWGRGALRENIETKIVLDSQLRGGYAEVSFGKLSSIARWVEYGHRNVGHRPGMKDLGTMTLPHPFIRPAFEAGVNKSIEAFVTSMTATLERGIPGFSSNPKLASGL